MCQQRGFQIIVIVDMPNGSYPLVSFIAIHHNHCVINDFFGFLQPQYFFPFKTITRHFGAVTLTRATTIVTCA
jgi:hypothetical protein